MQAVEPPLFHDLPFVAVAIWLCGQRDQVEGGHLTEIPLDFWWHKCSPFDPVQLGAWQKKNCCWMAFSSSTTFLFATIVVLGLDLLTNLLIVIDQ